LKNKGFIDETNRENIKAGSWRLGGFNTESQNLIFAKHEESDLTEIQGLLVRERARYKQLKLLAEQDLETERKLRIELEDTIIRLKESIIHKEQAFSDLQFNHNNSLSEISASRAEITALKKEINLIREQSNVKIRDLEKEILALERELDASELKYQKDIKVALRDNEDFVTSVVEEWQAR
jgi:hypothetical protein